MPASTSADVDPLALEQQVCFALAITNRAVLSIYRPLLEPLNLTHPQYLVMLSLWDHQKASAEGDPPLSVKQIATALQLTRPRCRRCSNDCRHLGSSPAPGAPPTSARLISSSPTTETPCATAHLQSRPPSWLDSEPTWPNSTNCARC